MLKIMEAHAVNSCGIATVILMSCFVMLRFKPSTFVFCPIDIECCCEDSGKLHWIYDDMHRVFHACHFACSYVLAGGVHVTYLS